MPISYQEQAQLTCPACSAPFEASVWLILDAQEQPEAVGALERGELNRVACPACGHSGPAGAPLMFHDGAIRRVIFAGAAGAAEHELRDQARDLHAVLVGSIPEEQRRPYLADVDIVQDLDGVARVLRRLARRRRAPDLAATQASPPASPSLEQTQGVVPQPPLEQTPPTGVLPPLLLAVEAMLAANTPAELEQVVAANPLLRDPATDATLAELVALAHEQREHEVAANLSRARELLLRNDASATLTVPPLADELPDAAFQALLQAASAAELEAVAVAYPALLRPRAEELLAERVELALDDGNERLAQALEERREALVQLRAASAGVRAAGEPDAGPATLATLDEAIEALLVAEGEAALADTIDRYPVLLEDVAAQSLWQFAAEARASGDEELARYVIACREMLHRVREGLEQ